MTVHVRETQQKMGHAWTNGVETFPATPLYRCTCTCGWQGAAWYSTPERAARHHERHLEAVEREAIA